MAVKVKHRARVESGPPPLSHKTETDMSQKLHRKTSLAGSLQNLAKSAFGRRNRRQTPKESEDSTENSEGKRKRSFYASTACSMSSFFFPSSPSTTFRANLGHASQEVFQEKRKPSRPSLSRTPSPPPPPPPTAVSSPLPEPPARTRVRRPTRSRIPTPTKSPSGGLYSHTIFQFQRPDTMNPSMPEHPHAVYSKKDEQCLLPRTSELEPSMQSFEKNQENERQRTGNEERKGTTHSPIKSQKNQQTDIRMSRLPRSSLPSCTLADSLQKRTPNVEIPLPSSKSFSSCLSTASSPRRGSLPPPRISAGPTWKSSSSMMQPLQGDRSAFTIQKSTIACSDSDVIEQVAVNSTSLKEVHVRPSITPPRQLLQPLGPPMPKSQTFSVLTQYQTARPPPTPKDAKSRMSDVSDRTVRGPHRKNSPENEGGAEVVAFLKATRRSKGDVEDEKKWMLTRPERMKIKRKETSDYQIKASLPEQHKVAGDESKGKTDRMVSQAQPVEYWLGRFVTLTNAFHYEDSFKGPDIATGFGKRSGFSRPPASLDAGLADVRTRRAFFILENVCTTEEARESLRKFRDEYTARFGDRWTCWLVEERTLDSESLATKPAGREMLPET